MNNLNLPQNVQNRIQHLQVWRREIASQRKLPAYRVFSNRTLIELAEQFPQSLEELILIKGIKEKRIADFGEDLLKQLKTLPRP